MPRRTLPTIHTARFVGRVPVPVGVSKYRLGRQSVPTRRINEIVRGSVRSRAETAPSNGALIRDIGTVLAKNSSRLPTWKYKGSGSGRLRKDAKVRAGDSASS